MEEADDDACKPPRNEQATDSRRDEEEFDGEHIVVRIRATPVDRPEGGRLAREVLGAIAVLRQSGDRAGAGVG